MRISTANSYDAGVVTLQRRQTELTDAQERLTSGKRVTRASDDPVAAARAERALAGEARVRASERSVENSRSMMMQAEGALGEAGELMQQAREIIVNSGNASYGAAERKSMAVQLGQIRDQLMAIANRSDGAGSFLFGGQGASVQPFVDSRPQAGVVPEQTGATYVGSAGVAMTEPGSNLPLALDGAAIWLSARTGNGVFDVRPPTGGQGAWVETARVIAPGSITGNNYDVAYDAATQSVAITNTDTGAVVGSRPFVAGQAIEFDGIELTLNGTPLDGETYRIVPSTANLSVFGALDKAVADLSNGAGGAALNQSVFDNLRNLDAAMGGLQAARSRAGEALSRIDSASNQLASEKLHHQTERASAEDLDMVAAISEFESKQTGYDAALKSYSMVQRMSLFQYLNV
ncbi:flagellar hook-associated protein FlgL [Piscinibacter sakaiensis]|uniref:flagellar hook-associated protein FlgL n=1 Tax=Piscinibacter sakaiensis TaxID=1547922 RepID=UPI003AB0F2F4